jgi:hypothetical protein
MVRTEDNNPGKEFSRPQLVAIINHYLKNENKIMFEFLGGGVGAEYYAKHIEDLKVMVLCERDKNKITEWNNSGRHNKLPVDIKIMSTDALSVLDNKCTDLYNVLNLDFCTFYFDNGTDNCTSGIIKKALKNKVVSNGGLLLTTFMITGIGVNMHKTALKNKEDISKDIAKIAQECGYVIEEVHAYAYKSNKPTTMLNLVFKLNIT